ncbi:MAG: hypothetical protein GY772_05215 [bacterium]|nr:hypothetical protein [bacterium]
MCPTGQLARLRGLRACGAMAAPQPDAPPAMTSAEAAALRTELASSERAARRAGVNQALKFVRKELTCIQYVR